MRRDNLQGILFPKLVTSADDSSRCGNFDPAGKPQKPTRPNPCKKSSLGMDAARGKWGLGGSHLGDQKGEAPTCQLDTFPDRGPAMTGRVLNEAMSPVILQFRGSN